MTDGYAVDLGDAVLALPEPHGLTPYSWRGVCRVPECRRPATDPHDIVPRGRTGGPLRYVLLDGQLVAIVAGLCARHHDRITTGVSMIHWLTPRWHYSSPERPDPQPLLPLGNEGAIRATNGRYCPQCGRPPVRRDPYTHTRRPRRGYSIRVPDDAEDGAAVISNLAEQVGEAIGLADPSDPGGQYYAISAALAACLMEPGMLADLAP